VQRTCSLHEVLIELASSALNNNLAPKALQKCLTLKIQFGVEEEYKFSVLRPHELMVVRDSDVRLDFYRHLCQ
jgi:hypothetical protein